MDEYTVSEIRKLIKEEKTKKKRREMTNNRGMMGVRGFKINFAEMMKVRAKIKKDPQQKKNF